MAFYNSWLLHICRQGTEEQVKPRVLRFTWSMKTTSSRDPNEIMAEIRKVGGKYFFLQINTMYLNIYLS